MTGPATIGTMDAALDAAAGGDQAAFARIVSAYHADLVRVAYGICGDPAMALDAAQGAWLIAWRKLGNVREADHLRGWLIAVAANEARHLVRRANRDAVHEIPLAEEAGAVDPLDGLARLDLVNALRRLDPDDRALVALRYGADLDSTEIAPLLRISASGVRTRLLRVMTRLRKDLDDGRA